MSGTNSSPNFKRGDRPSAAEWNNDFAVKVDALGGHATALRVHSGTTPTLPLGDSTEALANTEFVSNAVSTSGGYVLPVATPTALGGVMPDGTTLANNGGGALSVRYGATAGTAAAGDDSRIAGALSATTAAVTYAPLSSPALTGFPTAPTPPTSSDNVSIATSGFVWNALAASLRGYLFGMRLSNDVTTPNTVLDINAGLATDSTNTTMIALDAPLTKSVSSAWAAGTGAGGMGVGLTATNATWYHVFVIVVAGVGDVYFDTSVVAANKPFGADFFRRIGSFRINATGQIRTFVQNGDRFDLTAPVLEYNATAGVLTAASLTINNVPLGVVVQAQLSGIISDPTTANAVLWLSSLAQTDTAPTVAAAVTAVSGPTTANGAYNVTVVTNTSAQIRKRVSSTTALVNVLCNGWIDSRGRLG